MDLSYHQITPNLANNLENYDAGAWNLFYSNVVSDLNAVVVYLTNNQKNISLLKNNLPYIQNSVSNVYGNGTSNRAKFTYYNQVSGETSSIESKPILADPNNESKPVFTESFKPNLDNGIGFKRDNGLTIHSIYDEQGSIGTILVDDNMGFSNYTAVNTSDNSTTLLAKTNRWFKQTADDYIQNRFKTLHSRFHTVGDTPEELESDISNSAFSKQYGLSHGRNLLKQEPDESMGYDNPYCRVWTHHHQYHQLVTDTMRPFLKDDKTPANNQELNTGYNWLAFRAGASGGFEDGGTRLDKYGAMYDNAGRTVGMVNITPTDDGTGVNSNTNVSLQHCMFSIENLAWKGVTDILSIEQKGPLGGRIMWFPPYDISFSETSQARWEENGFIGRGEPMYTYSNTSRTGRLSFKLLIDHPSVLDYWVRRGELGNPKQSGVDDLDSKEQELLRFFAGCTKLSSKEPPAPEPTPEDKPESSTPDGSDDLIQFFVFYPNNYSGKDDNNANSEVNPIEYLLNGIDTQQYYPDPNKTSKSTPQSVIPLTMNTIWTLDKQEKQIGGYEMRDVGISTQTEAIYGNPISYVHGKVTAVVTSVDYTYLTAKMIGSDASEFGSKGKEFYKCRYYYRADKNTLNQILLGGKDAYIDNKSYQLNSTGYQKAVTACKLKDVDKTYSLTEIYVALKGDAFGVLEGLYDPEHVAVIKSILKGEKGKITKIICKGMHSTQANSVRANLNQKSLASNRAKTIKEWLKNELTDKDIKWESRAVATSMQSDTKHDVNELNAKLTRRAFVEIHYNKAEVEDATQTQTDVDTSGQPTNESIVITNESTGSTEDLTENAPKDAKSSANGETQSVIGNVSKNRYEQEAQFFEKLKANDPFMTRLLSERIKYFNPAFHSMSPEGFNARLTFLNQCLRQGPTISGADSNNANANNLSFGRPPVCVLRVGDFYNTKIIIDSLDIQYDPLLWDLNQEGIGVMPMIASVSLNFKFIGGSDLGGPIQRLQNALSFNYYANAGVYDNRAENIKYSNNGNVERFKVFGPN